MSYFNRLILIIELLKMFQPIVSYKIVILERNHVQKIVVLIIVIIKMLCLKLSGFWNAKKKKKALVV